MQSDRLLYVMDPMCSWCWGFAPVVRALAQQAAAEGVPLQLRLGGLRRERTALDPQTRGRILAHWQAVQASTGQSFDFAAALPQGFIYDTEPACRALVIAQSLDQTRVWPLLELIQQAFYAEGRDVTRAALLVELAGQAGFARGEFAAAFDGAEAIAATAADFTWVEHLGIAGFPTLLAERGGRLALLTNGYQPLEALAPLLGRWLEQRAHA